LDDLILIHIKGSEKTIQLFLINLNKAIMNYLKIQLKTEPNSPRKSLPTTIPSGRDISATPNTDKDNQTGIIKQTEQELVQEFKAMSDQELLQRVEEMRRAFNGFPYCTVNAGVPLAQLNLAFMETDNIKVLMEKEAALAASLEGSAST